MPKENERGSSYHKKAKERPTSGTLSCIRAWRASVLAPLPLLVLLVDSAADAVPLLDRRLEIDETAKHRGIRARAGLRDIART